MTGNKHGRRLSNPRTRVARVRLDEFVFTTVLTTTPYCNYMTSCSHRRLYLLSSSSQPGTRARPKDQSHLPLMGPFVVLLQAEERKAADADTIDFDEDLRRVQQKARMQAAVRPTLIRVHVRYSCVLHAARPLPLAHASLPPGVVMSLMYISLACVSVHLSVCLCLHER